jgi:hypothetical protein
MGSRHLRLAAARSKCHAGGVKAVLPVAVLMLAMFQASGATIPSAEAAAHVGETVIVRGTVAQVSTVGGGMTFVNFGRPHPDSEFTAVVRPGASGFDNLADFQGKEVEVEGTIELHKGRPQIVLLSPENIRTAGEKAPAATEMPSSPEPVAAPEPVAPVVSTLTPVPEETAADEPAPARAGALEEFKVPLNDEEKKMAGRSPAGEKPEEATVGIMLPEGFDPSQPQKVLVVFSTDDNGDDHLKAMPRFGGIATRNGWVAIAAKGPVLENNLSPEWHAAMIYAGLRALEERYPRAKTWRFFTGGNSGGGLRSAMMSCALLKKGYPVEGVFMGGAGDERFSAGLGIFRPERAKVRNLAVYIAIGKHDPMINAARADYVAEVVKKQGIKNIRRDSYDGGHGMNEESFTKALEWFAGGAK